MNQKIYKTIIIGGGISGLSCARRLYDRKQDFLLISENLGGRMISAEPCGMDYGAIYLTSDYQNVLKYVDKTDRIHLRDFFFARGKEYRNLFYWKNIIYIFDIFRLIILLRKLRKHMLIYRKQASQREFAECIREDPFLYSLWTTPAREYIRQHGFRALDRIWGDKIASSTMFVGSNNINTLCYLGLFYPLSQKTWVVSFKNTVSKMIAGYKDKILKKQVKKVIRNQDGSFTVQTNNKNFIAENIVLAIPGKAIPKIYNLKGLHKQQPIYVLHVAGTRIRAHRDKKAILFDPKKNDVYMIWQQKCRTDILYTQYANPNLSAYYDDYRVLNKTHWTPAMTIPDDKLVSQKPEANLYLASDCNISMMEESFLTGLYAANQILKH